MIRTVLFILLFISQTSWMQMLPDAPIKDFMVPGFSEEGYTEWILKGSQLEYKSEELVIVKDMYLQMVTPDENQVVTTEMRSPSAHFLLKENKADSDSSIEIRGPNFHISGVKWTWDGTGETKKITIEDWASVTFYEELDEFLK